MWGRAIHSLAFCLVTSNLLITIPTSIGQNQPHRCKTMTIHVRIALEYRGIPFEIEVESTVVESLDLNHLGVLLDKVKKFIDKMLEAKKQ